MSDEDEVQCALALLQTSIKQFGPEDRLILGCKKCTPMPLALRGHKFLKENGFVTATIRVGTFVTEPYTDLGEVLEIIKSEHNATLSIPLFTVSDGRRRGRARRGSSAAVRVPRTRVRVQRADVVHVSPNSDEPASSEGQSMDSTEIMNTTDLREDSADSDSDSVTGVTRRSAEQLSPRGRFLLQEQRFVNGFNARDETQGDIMMTIKLFGATVPVPANTIVFPPWRDWELED